jgi:hypothetical protein
MSNSSQMMLSDTKSSQKAFNKGCTRISLEMKPVMLPFFTLFEVDKPNHVLKPYMAPVNHNVINETSWIRIFHTFYGNFYHVEITASSGRVVVVRRAPYWGPRGAR